VNRRQTEALVKRERTPIRVAAAPATYPGVFWLKVECSEEARSETRFELAKARMDPMRDR